jgi:hypothetical protein
MAELAKIQTSQVSRNVSEQFAVAIIVFLLIAVQAIFIAKHTITLNAAEAPATLSGSTP